MEVDLQMELYTCAVTGHRPTRFKWKYNENNNGCKRLKKRMKEQFTLLYEKGVRRFYVGGALGVDMWAGEILLQMKELPDYKDIHLIVVLPFDGYNKTWDSQSKNRLQFLLNHSAENIIVGQRTQAPAVCYKLRNYYMINHADCLLAVYDDNRSIRSGTGMTVNYARKRELKIKLIHPDTGVVTIM